jgi:hypothetical protein
MGKELGMGVSNRTYIVVLDHTLGRLETDEKGAPEVDLLPTAESAVSALLEKGHSVILLVPRERDLPDASALFQDSPQLSAISIAGGTLEDTLRTCKAEHGEAVTVLVAADRKSRQIALGSYGIEPIPHYHMAEWLLAGEPVSAERFGGQAPLDAGGTILSRHISHVDNQRAVAQLTADLAALGYCSYTHAFTYGGQTLHNVIGDLPGTGYLRIDPVLIEKIMRVLVKYPRPWTWQEIERELEGVLGARTLKQIKLQLRGPLKLTLEELVGIYRWWPWRRYRQFRIGLGSQLVIVGSHLDSSANRSAGPYDPAVDPAPGVDDNASGIACGLAIARYLSAFRGSLIHTVRFCFFNAEEAGLVGSKAYAASLKAMGAPVKAVICPDMIGYNSDANWIFEIHAGCTDPALRDLNLPLARSVQTWAASSGALAPAQVYKGTSPSEGAPNRDLYDPAIDRSDHAAFHQQGYKAIAVTEDYFANMPTEPGKDPNPNYHTAEDTVIDADFGTAITCAIASAVKELASD